MQPRGTTLLGRAEARPTQLLLPPGLPGGVPPFFRQLRGDLLRGRTPGLAPSPDRFSPPPRILVPIDAVQRGAVYRQRGRVVVTVSARFAVRVQPGASRTAVGGRRGDALVVRVTARAVDGAANRAALTAVAEALEVRPRQVLLVHGSSHRDKLLEVVDPPEDLADRLATLLGGA